MEFVLRIRCESAAFTDESNWEDEAANKTARAAEVTRIIRNIDPERIEIASTTGRQFSLLDVNGVTVGGYHFQKEQA